MKEIKKQDRRFGRIIGAQTIQSGKEYQLSRFAVQKESDRYLYLFHTFTHQCLQLEKTILKESVSSEELTGRPDLETMVKNWFYVEKGKDENEFYYGFWRILRTLESKSGYYNYILYPTNGCNARCVYCIHEEMQHKSMTEETALQTAKFIAETHRKNETIVLFWFGGEPLLGEKKIDLISDYLREHQVPFSGTMLTNGSLINSRILQKMKERWNIHTVQVSMDAGEAEYIRRKNYYSYHDEYCSVMKNVNALNENGIATYVRCNVDWDNVEEGAGFLRDLKKEVKDPSKVVVYFEPLVETRGREDSPLLWEKTYELDRLVKEEGFSRQFSDLPSHILPFYCSFDGASGRITVAQDGKLYGCHDCIPNALYGDVRNGIVEQENWKKSNELCEIREKCKDCPYLPLCTPFSRCPHEEEDCKEKPRRVVTQGFENLIARIESAPESK